MPDYMYLAILIGYGVVSLILIWVWPREPEVLYIDITVDIGAFTEAVKKAGVSTQEFAHALAQFSVACRKASESFSDFYTSVGPEAELIKGDNDGTKRS